MSITRTEYKKARRFLRDNGESYALRVMDKAASAVFRSILFAGEDLLQGRIELRGMFAPELMPQVLKHDIRAAQDLRQTRQLAA